MLKIRLRTSKFICQFQISLHTKIIVAGGCKDWCNRGEPMSSAEIYDLETKKWKLAADMPLPLSSASMEVFDGLPTTVGGVSMDENGGFFGVSELYQYDITSNTWSPHPNTKMRTPRSSGAVFQVPRSYFHNC